MKYFYGFESNPSMPKCYRTIVIERLRKEGGAFGIPRAHTGAKLAP